MDELRAKLAEHGITLTPAFTGEYSRFGSQFFKGIDLGDGAYWVNFGDWSKKGCNITMTLTGAGGKVTAEQQAKIAAALALQDAERRQYWETVALEAQKLWDNATDRGNHPYLDKKKLSSLHGARIWMNEAGHPVILVPMRDKLGKLWNVTRIFSKEFVDEKTGEKRGNKFVLKGGRKEGLFHTIGAHDGGHLLFAEGFATGASLREAFPERTVIVCFDAGNLEAAAGDYLAERKDKPESCIFCGDDDVYKPKSGNAGREAAQGCAAKFDGATAVFPRFKNTRTCPTDWNDLHCLEGLEAVKEQVLNPPPADESQGGNLAEKKVGERAVVANLINSFGDTLIKQDRDLFLYNEKAELWRHYPQREAQDHFMKLIDALAGSGAKYKDLKSAYDRFLMHVPYLDRDRNMHAPPPFITNFKNGAVELNPQSDGSYKLEFRKKRQDDYLCYTHPFDYTPEASLNEEFEETIKRVLPESAINTYYEVLGGCLIPAFPKVALFVGPPGSGKSTLILFAYHLVDKALRASVDPSDWRGFAMETLLGKLVNLHPDIALSRPIAENILKLIEDRVPVRIARKYATDVSAPLPAMHLFGANGLPKTQESVNAFTRRVLIFRCDRYQAPETGFTRDFAHHVWAKNPAGVVRRALEGAARLAADKGHFSMFDAAREEMDRWKLDTADFVERFVAELRIEGGALLADADSRASLTERGQLTRSQLVTAFHSWFERAAPRKVPPDAFELYRRLRELGFHEKMIKGVRYFHGFGVTMAPNSLC